VQKKIRKKNISREITLNNSRASCKNKNWFCIFIEIGEIPLSFGFLYAILLSNSISWLFRGWHALRNKCLCGSLGHRFAPPRRVERVVTHDQEDTHTNTSVYRARLWNKVASTLGSSQPNCRRINAGRFREVKSQLRSSHYYTEWLAILFQWEF